MSLVTRRRKPRTPRIRRNKSDFDWSGAEEMSGKDFYNLRWKGISFYRDNNTSGGLINDLYQFMSDNGYDEYEIDAVKAVPIWKISDHACILAKCLMTGMPDVHEKWTEYLLSLPGVKDAPQKASDYVHDAIDNAMIEGNKILAEKKTDSAPISKDRSSEQVRLACVEIENWLDSFTKNPKKFDPTSMNVNTHFKAMGVTTAQARLIRKRYAPQMDEMVEVSNLPSLTKIQKISDVTERDMAEQLKESYQHLTKKNIDDIVTALTNIVTAADMIIDAGKANRKPRTRKAKDINKLAEKIKYKQTDEAYSLVSVSPVTIFGASELWVFNSKLRKVGVYKAKKDETLFVKGTTLQNYDEEASLQKTVRKPLEQLPVFKKAGKVQRRKWFENIKAVPTKLSGRLMGDVVLLKTVK